MANNKNNSTENNKNTVYTRAEWLAEAKRRFGDNPLDWKFKCPACGRVYSVREIKDAAGRLAFTPYQECIGRYKGAGSPDPKHNENGCNWAAYGIFGTMCKGIKVVTDDGKEIDAFDFADEETPTN